MHRLTRIGLALGYPACCAVWFTHTFRHWPERTRRRYGRAHCTPVWSDPRRDYQGNPGCDGYVPCPDCVRANRPRPNYNRPDHVVNRIIESTGAR